MSYELSCCELTIEPATRNPQPATRNPQTRNQKFKL